MLSVLGKSLVLSKDVSVKEKSIPMVQKDSIQTVCSVREAYFSSGETLLTKQAMGRVCRMPMAACPPAIPVVVPGERIDQTAIECLLYYGIKTIEVVKEEIEQDR